MDTQTRGLIAGAIFVVFGLVTINSGWFSVSASQTEDKLEALAKTALQDAGFYDVAVDVKGQAARLTGNLPSNEAVDDAIGTVKSALWGGGIMQGGITTVRADRLTITPPPARAPRSLNWSASKIEGPVVLSGRVPGSQAKTSVADHASSLFPQGVSDEMRFGPGPDEGWSGVAETSVTALSALRAGQVQAEGNRFAIVGETYSEETAEEIERSFGTLGEGFYGSADITVVDADSPVSSYDLIATTNTEDGDVVLYGEVPGQLHRVALRRLAQGLFRGGVTDQMTVRPGNAFEGWFTSAKRGLTALSSLESGSLEFKNRTLSLEGTAASAAIASNTLGRLDGLPGGVGLAENISIVAPDPIESIRECQAIFDGLADAASINFDSGNATIRPVSFPLLDSYARAALSCRTFGFEISGHTDNTGDPGFNQTLSVDRAEAVAEYLNASGVIADRLSTSGFGDTKPIAENETPAGRQANRRIEFVVIRQEQD